MIHRDRLLSSAKGGGQATLVACPASRIVEFQKEMELRGLEPLTSWVRSRRSPS
jgi:hypothetical protein